jgi:hypothetical protein
MANPPIKLTAKDCQICHVDEMKWLSTDMHSQAFQRLKPDQKGDLRCVGCHQSSENMIFVMKDQNQNQDQDQETEDQKSKWVKLLRQRSKSIDQAIQTFQKNNQASVRKASDHEKVQENLMKREILQKKQNLIENMLSSALKEQNVKQSDIACQDCHGIGKLNLSAKNDESIHLGLKTIQSRVCERCHTLDQSRLQPFRFEEAVTKIKHAITHDQE